MNGMPVRYLYKIIQISPRERYAIKKFIFFFCPFSAMLTYEPPYRQKSYEPKFFLVNLDQVKHEYYEFEIKLVKFEYHF